MSNEIAIVGLACCYPDAPTPAALWENALAQRRAFRRLPAERLNLGDYYSPDQNEADQIYATNAAVISDYEFDRARYRIGGAAYRSADLVHWLALDIAARALEDAGAKDGLDLPRSMTGVFLGNTLTGEFSRANVMRLRWPYVRRVVAATLAAEGWDETQQSVYLQKLEAVYKEPFAPMAEDSLAGGLSNTIAGRICNYFDFQGGGYTVDGACSSSLLAVAQACAALRVGDVDVALAGGVDVSIDPFELVGFSRTKALAADMMRVYEARSSGFWPGEGCGFALLMRHDDALAQGRKIYAVIRGWGISTDGSGGITRPSAAGQQLALERAYARAGFGLETVTYFEGHGTGTSVGDATELRGLSTARRQALEKSGETDAPPAFIGSLKANIGHTKAAAGIAGFIKATLALHHRVIPPMTAWEKPHAELVGPAPMLQITPEGQPWPAGRHLRAGVSSMGFGGINAHVSLAGANEEKALRRALSTRERYLLASAQDAELFLFSAPDAASLRSQIEQINAYAARLSFSELTDLAAQTARDAGHHKHRAAVMASTPAELAERLARLLMLLERPAPEKIKSNDNVFYGVARRQPVIGFLFPGQASPSYFGGGLWARRFAVARELYEQAEIKPGRREGDTDAAQPAIIAAELAALRVLRRLDITAEKAVGHSLGELAAYHWAGALSEPAVLRVAKGRGQAMMGAETGAMASLRASATQAAALLNGEGVVIAGYNAPLQTVVSGRTEGLAYVLEKAAAARLSAVKLPVSHAFHSPLLASAKPALAACLEREEWEPLEAQVFSTITGGALAPDTGLEALLLKQITEPVRFTDAVQAAGAADLWLEAGPGGVLSGLMQDFAETPVIALDAGGASLKGLLRAAGAAFVLGQDINHEALAAERFTRPFDLNWQPRFFANPCEMAPRLDLPAILAPLPSPAVAPAPSIAPEDAPASALELIKMLVAERAELPLSAVQPEHHLLSDLHLNSLTVGQLVAEAAKRLNIPRPLAPSEFADATIREVAATLDASAERGDFAEAEETPAGVDNWVRPFCVEWREELLTNRPETKKAGRWTVFGAGGETLAAALESAEAGAGVLVCLPAQASVEQSAWLVEAAQAALSGAGEHFVIVQQAGNGAASFARSLHLEAPQLTTCVIEVNDLQQLDAGQIVAEVKAARGHVEARYAADGKRGVPVWRPLETAGKELKPLPLGVADVLLVTGGGKGITAECALTLAKATGAKLALLGRSLPEFDRELTGNLARIADAGVTCRYFAADITDADAVRSAVAATERELGPVTALLHGAAVNEPQLLAKADASEFQRCLNVKVGGAGHILAALDPEKLRLFIAFGSIIARTGLPGEAAYALANEQLTRLAENWGAAHPACRCLAVEWSVWGGVGMGARLGLLENLMRQGITPIAPEEGAAMLQTLLAQPTPSAVVVMGRYREMPTYRIEREELPLLRFLEQPRVYYPSIELVADAELSPDTDLYLNDHQVHGERLLPGVLGLEAMAQAARVLHGQETPGEFQKVEFLYPVVVPENAPLTIRVAALRRENGLVEAVIRCSDTNFQRDHFRAVYAPTPGPAPASEALPEIDEALARALSPEQDLYGNILFHQGRFRRLRGYRTLRAQACCAEIAPDGEVEWFSQYLPKELLLGDVGARDAAIHVVQACIPQTILLPVSVEKLRLGRLATDATHYVVARETAREGGDFVYDVRVCDEHGAAREHWQGLRLRMVRGSAAPQIWSAPLLANYATRRLRELWADEEISLAIVDEPQGERRARSQKAMGLALEKPETIRYRPDGKPESVSGRPVSASHCGALTLGAAGLAACDLEAARERSLEEWRDLLGASRLALAETICAESGESLAAAATRLWSAGECLRKAGVLDAPLVLQSVAPDGWVTLSAGAKSIVSFVARMRGGESLCVAALRENNGGG